MSENYTLYMHTSPSGKRYAGITSQPVVRRWSNGLGYRNCRYFRKAIEKYGWDNIHHEILLTGLTKEEAEKRERFYITLFRTQNQKYGYNLMSGGHLNGLHATETKKRIGELVRGERNGMYGKSMSPEAKAKIVEARKARPISAETKAKLSESHRGDKNSMYGKHHTLESRQKMSEATRGEKHHSYGKTFDEEHRRKLSEALRKSRGVTVVNLDTQETYNSVAEAAECCGISAGALGNCVRGYTKTAGGYHWARAEVDDNVPKPD